MSTAHSASSRPQTKIAWQRLATASGHRDDWDPHFVSTPSDYQSDNYFDEPNGLSESSQGSSLFDVWVAAVLVRRGSARLRPATCGNV